MRVNAANNLDFAAWARSPNGVHLRVGWHRYTATAEEAIELARQLDAAATYIGGPHHG